MSEAKFTKLSRGDYEIVQEARKEIAEAERNIEKLIPRHLKLSANAKVEELNFTRLSRDDYEEIRKERHRIVDAERRIAKLVLDQLEIVSENPSIQRIPLEAEGALRTAAGGVLRSFEVIYCGCCDPCGVYVDPPGVCAPI